MNIEDIDKLQALLEAGTKGPFTLDWDDMAVASPVVNKCQWEWIIAPPENIEDPTICHSQQCRTGLSEKTVLQANCRMVCEMLNRAPALLETARRLGDMEAENARLREALEESGFDLTDALLEVDAKRIYNGWSDQYGWVPWTKGGNSDMQFYARRQAKREAALANTGGKEGCVTEPPVMTPADSLTA